MTTRREWGAGPWNDEPDSDDWRDPATGYSCAIRRHIVSGHLCGYVCLPPEHPLHGVDRSAEVPDAFVQDVQGLMGQSIGKRAFMDVFLNMVSGTDRVAILFDVHDSVTYSKQHGVDDDYLPPGFWYGFACGSTSDLQPGIAAVIRKEMRDVDMANRFPMLQQMLRDQQYRTIGYVRSEVESLARQLHALAHVFDLMTAEAKDTAQQLLAQLREESK